MASSWFSLYSRFCDLQFSCGACSPDPFGSNSGSNLLKLAQALAAKSVTDIRFLQIWKLHGDNWKLLFILSDFQMPIVELHTLSALQSITSKLDPSHPSSVLTGFGLSQVRCLCWNPVDQCVYCCSMLLSAILMHAEPWTSKIITYTQIVTLEHSHCTCSEHNINQSSFSNISDCHKSMWSGQHFHFMFRASPFHISFRRLATLAVNLLFFFGPTRKKQLCHRPWSVLSNPT